MTSPSNPKKGAFASRPALARLVAVKRLFARLVLVCEQILPLLLLPLSILALFLSAAWFGIFRIAPDMLRLALLAAFAITFAAACFPFRRLRWPTVGEADRMLEERNGLPHQPVTVQEDEPAFDTPFARALWREHQTRMAARIAALDAGFPRPDIARYDRFALRTIPALLLVTAFSFSMSNSGGSLSDAFLAPAITSNNPDVRVDAWVTPPYYTGEAPIYLTGNAANAGDSVNVPQFSELTVRVTGASADEKALFKPADSDTSTEIPEQVADAGKQAPANGDTTAPTAQPVADTASPPAAPGTAAMVARTHVQKLEKGGKLTVNGKSWSFNVVVDKPPEIAFDGIPHATANGSLEIGFKVKDDYGVEEARAEIMPVDADPQATPLYGLPEYKLEISRRDRRDGKGLTSRDLTQDPLAGKKVHITLVARDGAGQTGRSAPYEMTLPSRNFGQPLAAAVAEERQVFALDTRKMPEAIELNKSLAIRPDETIPDLGNYLLIKSALTRMKLAGGDAALKDTADYLWQIALGMEDAQLTDAEKALRDAQQKLSDALQRNAPDAEIKKLMDELRKAMGDYMKELAERMKNMPAQPNQKSANILRQQDLQRMMDQIENLARSGNRQAAQQMLSELQQMMNNLQAGRPQRDQNQQQGQANDKMRQQMDKLGRILRDQQKLMEQTFKLDQTMRDRMQRGDPNEDGDDALNQPMPGLDDPQQPDMGQQDQNQRPGQNQQGQQQPGQKQGDNETDGMTADQLRDALKQLRQQQDDLGKQLGELQKELGSMGMKPNQNYGKAQQEMKGAAGELGQGNGETAVQGQGRALDALRKGTRDMMNQLMAQMQQQGQGQGQQQGQAGQGNQNGRDPLGRLRDGPPGIFDETNENKIPKIIDAQRAREILDAIRERLSNNPSLSDERNYLERLLDMRQ
ncbi:TIGR02302 family protein [Rhizobium rhizogenes]|uniref:TIGR02302 family protein n=1 Tax=Rhizobium rhizogenes TaxID=359 RepID=UPI001574D108|nr:TIGR02302 family protein [Rhizobium rhizogenes]NTH19949.1 TIGR02302 family protein [Rhizobium rhizogenes]NTH32959.1 TIGR02302 family protein [Rhizobium rhizogenes]